MPRGSSLMAALGDITSSRLGLDSMVDASLKVMGMQVHYRDAAFGDPELRTSLSFSRMRTAQATSTTLPNNTKPNVHNRPSTKAPSTAHRNLHVLLISTTVCNSTARRTDQLTQMQRSTAIF